VKQKFALKSKTTMSIIFVFAIAVVWLIYFQIDRYMRANLLQQAQKIALSINLAEIKNLTASETDLLSGYYKRIKKQLADVRSGDPKCKYAYLMGRNADGRVFFFADVGDHNESLPGEIYEDASEKLHNAFDTGNAFLEGPLSDKWGIWVSAIVPRIDQKTKTVIAIIGMDYDAVEWKSDIVLKSTIIAAFRSDILLYKNLPY
jgi:hypothetical protein